MSTVVATYHIGSMSEQPHAAEEGSGRLGRLVIHKSFTGDLVGQSACEVMYFSTDDALPIMNGGQERKGSFVALERFTGKLLDREGSFVFEHGGQQEGTQPRPRGRIISGSGTGDLAGISGEVLYPHNPNFPGRVELKVEFADSLKVDGEGELSSENSVSATTVSDHDEIRSVLARYSWALDLGQVDQVVECFTSDALYEGMTGTWNGSSGIADMAIMVSGSESTQIMQHWPSNTIFRRTVDGYDVMSMIMGPRSGENPGVAFVGYYLDTFVRNTRGWRIKTRKYHIWDQTKHELPTEWLKAFSTESNLSAFRATNVK